MSTPGPDDGAGTSEAQQDSSEVLQDEGPEGSAPGREAVVDVLGVLAYGELVAFERLAHDAQFAPSLADKDALAGMAVAEFGHYRSLRGRLDEIGLDPEQAMAPFVEALDAFHASTQPQTWLESVVKAYVGDGIASDFYREVARVLPEPERTLVRDVLDDAGQSLFAVAKVRDAITADTTLSGRLALWARRIVGEALAQAQRVAVDRETLAHVVAGSGDLAALGRLLTKLTDAHTERMAALGLRP